MKNSTVQKTILMCFIVLTILSIILLCDLITIDFNYSDGIVEKTETQNANFISEYDNEMEMLSINEPIISLGDFLVTAYCSCEKCCGKWAKDRPKDENGNEIVYTSTGAFATPGRTIAVDPTVVPYGTEVEINGNTYIAEDTGKAIKGNRIDVYFNDHIEAKEFGRQFFEVFVISF